MGEEEKKAEEAKKAVEEKKEEPAAAAADEKKSDAPPPPPPPQEIVLKVYMHCEGCARKVRRCLKGFPGVEEVITDCRTSKVSVKGEEADPVKVLERVQRKSHRQVQLISPIIPHPPNKEDKELLLKPEHKNEEPPMVITVVLGVYMHCEACAQEIKKRIHRMKGVETVEPDLKSSQVSVKGVFEPEKLADYVYKRTGKHAMIVKVVEPEKKEEEEEKGKEDNKKAEEGENEAKKDEAAAAKENKEGGPPPPAKAEAEMEEQKLDLKKNEFYYYYPQNYQVYPQRFVQDMYAYPPQIFSDENPNACSVM